MESKESMEPKKDESRDKCFDPVDCLVKFLFTALLILMVVGIAKLSENAPCGMTFYQPEFPQKNENLKNEVE
ncbi:MAG: hypothetical protein K6U80_12150 [Firmicutes bacterium]|nr:hypothetical protein [Bacillota bacterium]